MPRVKPPNYLAELFHRYRVAKKLTSAMIAKKVHTTPENVRAQLNKKATLWRIEDLVKYCNAVGVPIGEAFESIEKGLKT